MSIDWELADKVVKFVSDLSTIEKVALTTAGLTVLSPAAGILWKLARERGRAYEVLFGRVPAVALLLNECQHKHRMLLDELSRERDRNRVLEQDSEVRPDIDLPADISDILAIRKRLVEPDPEVWRLRDARPLPHLAERLAASGLIVITVGNLKGGVGKTTLAANLAAFFDRKLNKKVLVIDLDYQGSLSATMLQAAGRRLDASLTDHLLRGEGSGKWLVDSAKALSPALERTYLIPAGYTLASAEEQLMMRWLFHTTEKDVRFNLAEVLLAKEVREAEFKIVLLDVGPRLTTASISALCASTHLLVPTNLDRLAAETIGSLLNRVRSLKDSLGLPIELAGVVGTMTYQQNLRPEERDALGTVQEGLIHWGGEGHIFARTLPRKTKLAELAGSDIAYLRNKEIRTLFDELGAQIATRIGL